MTIRQRLPELRQPGAGDLCAIETKPPKPCQSLQVTTAFLTACREKISSRKKPGSAKAYVQVSFILDTFAYLTSLPAPRIRAL